MSEVSEKQVIFELNRPWEQLELDTEAIIWLENDVFYNYMLKCRWFAGKARTLKFCKVQQFLTMPFDDGLAYLIILHIGYTYGDEEKYAMPVSFIPAGHELINLVKPKAFIAELAANGQQGWLIDAIYDLRFQIRLFENIFNSASSPQKEGELAYQKGKGLAAADQNFGYPVHHP